MSFRELRVWAMDPARRVWTLRHTTVDLDDACHRATALRQAGLRVRVRPHLRKTLPVVPPVASPSAEFRHRVAGAMSDRADAKKRYKSPG